LDFEKGIVSPHVYLFDIDIEGTKTTAIAQDVQYHPVTDKIIHVDFLAVNEKKPIKVKLPVELTGTSVGVMRGGKLRLITRKLYVKGLMKDLPPTIKIDISNLDVAHGIKVSDVKVEGLTFLDPKQTPIVKVDASRSTAKTEEQEQ
ncbi:MAG TPA: 50S ribosomal protein L25, partial [Salinivirgaceae bacterium]|nr:50S ribosomal protein L25 [Salinivirgaceae bacterium]